MISAGFLQRTRESLKYFRTLPAECQQPRGGKPQTEETEFVNACEPMLTTKVENITLNAQEEGEMNKQASIYHPCFDGNSCGRRRKQDRLRL